MTDYETLARRVLGCESRERRGRLWCETHDEPWECPRATEVADELQEAWRAETDALLERLSAAERRIEAVRAEGAADGIEGLMHELACHRDAELAARRADQWRAQAEQMRADQ